MTLLEPAVALTDLGLALENALFAALLATTRPAERAMRGAWLVFFAALALAALLGFVSHGWIADKGSLAQRIVWSATLLGIGVIALSATAIAARLACETRAAHRITRAALWLGAAYALIVLLGYRRYVIAIAAYLPAALFLLYAFMRRQRERPALRAGIAGIVLTLAAAGVQQLGIGLHPLHFNHNALYHLIQALALALLFVASRALVRDRPPA
jgi:hypothetical protein